MKQTELRAVSEAFIRNELRKRLPQQNTPVYLFGSRARQTARWNSDYDLWVDADVPERVIAEIVEEIEESFVPFKVEMCAGIELMTLDKHLQSIVNPS